MSSIKFISKTTIAEQMELNAKYIWREIHANKALMRQLRECGYKKLQKTLTPKQASIIMRHYGMC